MATILVDMDDTILDLKTPWISRYNEINGTNFTCDDMCEWDVTGKFGPTIYPILKEEGFFASLQPYEGAIEVLQRLNEKHEIIIVTASVTGYAMKEKGEWVERYLPFLHCDNFMVARKKYKIQGDVLFDDGPHNIAAFNGVTIAKRHPHNPHAAPDYWVDTMFEFEKIIEDLYGVYKLPR